MSVRKRLARSSWPGGSLKSLPRRRPAIQSAKKRHSLIHGRLGRRFVREVGLDQGCFRDPAPKLCARAVDSNDLASAPQQGCNQRSTDASGCTSNDDLGSRPRGREWTGSDNSMGPAASLVCVKCVMSVNLEIRILLVHKTSGFHRTSGRSTSTRRPNIKLPRSKRFVNGVDRSLPKKLK